MSQLSKQALKVENQTSFPNNNTNYITPAILRDFNVDMIDSLVDENTYNADSASWNQQLQALSPQSINALNQATASLFTSTSLSLTTASFNNSTRNLTFTKGNGTQFSVNIPDVSGSTINTGSLTTTASFNAYTQSNDIKVNALIARTGSYATTGSNIFIGDNQVVGIFQVADANVGMQGFAPTVFQGVGTTAVAYDQFVNDGNYDAIHIESNLNQGTKFQDYNQSGLNTWLQIPTNPGTNPKPIFVRGLEVTGSANLQTLTASLANGLMFVGGANNLTKTITTASFATSASFNSYTSSNDNKVNALIAKTGSYATTGSNLFVASQFIQNGALQAANYTESSPQFFGGTVFQGVGTASVAYDQFVNAGNYDALHIETVLDNGTVFQDLDANTFGLSTWLQIPANPGTNPAPVFTRGLVSSGSVYIQSGSAFNESTGSALVAWNATTGKLTHTTYQSALPALYDIGCFYSTGSVTATANVSGSFTYTTTLNVDNITFSNGSRINVKKTGTYNIQFSIQISQGSASADIAVWLKKNGANVSNTATLITVPSNQKQVLALNLWDSANANDYYEIAYQSTSNNTTFQTIAASGNIPQSPAIIVTINQVR